MSWIVIPGEPVSQPRGRAVMRGPRPSIVTAQSSHAVWQYRDRIIHELQKLERVPPPGRPPLRLSVQFWFPFVGNPRKTKPNPAQFKTTKPDLDNLLKGLKDAISESQTLWSDDRQVVEYDQVQKFICAYGDQPQTLIRVEVLTLADLKAVTEIPF